MMMGLRLSSCSMLSAMLLVLAFNSSEVLAAKKPIKPKPVPKPIVVSKPQDVTRLTQNSPQRQTMKRHAAELAALRAERRKLQNDIQSALQRTQGRQASSIPEGTLRTEFFGHQRTVKWGPQRLAKMDSKISAKTRQFNQAQTAYAHVLAAQLRRPQGVANVRPAPANIRRPMSAAAARQAAAARAPVAGRPAVAPAGGPPPVPARAQGAGAPPPVPARARGAGAPPPVPARAQGAGAPPPVPARVQRLPPNVVLQQAVNRGRIMQRLPLTPAMAIAPGSRGLQARGPQGQPEGLRLALQRQLRIFENQQQLYRPSGG